LSISVFNKTGDLEYKGYDPKQNNNKLCE